MVGATFNVVGFGATPTSFSFSWNSQTSTVAVFQGNGGTRATGIAYLTTNSSAVADLVITPNDQCEIAGFATELPFPAVPIKDTSGSTSNQPAGFTMSCTQPMSSSPQIAICCTDGTSGTSGILFNPPFTNGQIGLFGITIGESYALLSSGTASATHTDNGTSTAAACIATFGTQPV